jgi:hypothetical protein
MLRTPSVLLLSSGLLVPLACGDADPASPPSDTDQASTGSVTAADSGSDGADGSSTTAADEVPTFTYYRDAKAVLDAKCAGCHRPGDIAPFSLETYDEVRGVAAVLPGSITAQTMPPWPPAPGCREYEHSRALTADEQDLLLTWLDEGAPEGDPADAPAPPDQAPDDFAPAVTIEMPEPYTPTVEPDENRCFLVPWPEAQTQYITGLRVVPGNRSVVHHVIMFNAPASAIADLEALDAEDAAPGYPCLGGVGAQADWIGAWAPGGDSNAVPEGTGMRVEPGSMMVLQMHYNTLSAEPAPDQTRVELALSDAVEHPAVTVPFTNFQWVVGSEPMLLPAGDPSVTYGHDLEADHPILRQRLADAGIGADAPFVVHAAGLHMHMLGTAGALSVVREGGDEDCMLRIDDWDFSWQGGYALSEPLAVTPGDRLRISCTWDNSADNQPVVDGEVAEPRDVQWGEGSTDEMCLGILYVTGQ